MKRFLFLILAIPVLAFGQDNSMFYPLEKDASYTLNSTTKKGKLSSTEVHKILSVETLPTGKKATVEISSFDHKGKLIVTYTYEVETNAETTKIDWRSKLSGVQNAAPKPLMLETSPCYLVLPNNPQVGQTIPDCTIKFEKGKALYEAIFYEIKFLSKESITVGGTTYDAFVLEYRFQTHLKEGLNITFDKFHRDWYVPGKGLVKSANANSSRNPKATDEMMFFSELK